MILMAFKLLFFKLLSDNLFNLDVLKSCHPLQGNRGKRPFKLNPLTNLMREDNF